MPSLLPTFDIGLPFKDTSYLHYDAAINNTTKSGQILLFSGSL